MNSWAVVGLVDGWMQVGQEAGGWTSLTFGVGDDATSGDVVQVIIDPESLAWLMRALMMPVTGGGNDRSVSKHVACALGFSRRTKLG